MADRNDVMRRPPRAPLRPRSRRRWAVAAVIAGVWALLLAGTGSLVVGTALFVLAAAVTILAAVALRGLGINSDHPWVRLLATRPWRDGSDVLRLGLRHLAEVFIVTPSGSLLAPNAVELLMNPDDLVALTEVMDLDVINASVTELYQAQVTAHQARLASAGPVSAGVAGDPAVPAGRYRVRQGGPRSLAPAVRYPAPQDAYLAAPGVYAAQDAYAPPDFYAPQDAYAAPQDVYGAPQDVYAAPQDVYGAPPGAPIAYPNGQAFPYAHDGRTRNEPDAARTVQTGQLTVTESASAPLLRLVTRGSIAETRVSGARAGRGDAVELVLPDEPTVSRVHAEFTFTGGQWRITGLGRNGVTLNGTPLIGPHVLGQGDSIRWGRRSDALVSRVEIG